MVKEIEEFLTRRKNFGFGLWFWNFWKKIKEKLKKEVIGIDIVDKRVSKFLLKFTMAKTFPFQMIISM
jgi:hypothetical protein